ncbi:hypothetical protein CCMSSC00406_0005825 [Pleurotus cornucopiae]|uniref:Uncharacterized protein n=1 Tax=Pleurotus cornucopiae TaxID=5321 RepID=A0ACB7J7G1_PLECO|nr:hypothetical protein CCMSSC00406_0005825 [Pleurotus cornucopiae]
MSVSAEGAASATTNKFVTALVTNLGLLAVEVGAFVVLKQRFGRIYQARTYLPPVDKRSQKLPSGPWRWVPAILHSPLEDIIHKNGLDAYMFLRYIRLLIIIFLIFTLLTFPIVIPLDAIGLDTGRTGLDRITWSNLADSDEQIRFVGHIILAYLLTGIVVFMIRREMNHFVHMRHQFLLSESHSRLPQARTVLITAVPDELGDEHALRTFASFTPGGVDRVWLYRDTKALNKIFEERRKLCSKLEKAISKLLRKATETWRTQERVHKKDVKLRKKQQKKMKDVEKDHNLLPHELERPPASFELLDELVPRGERPRHRVGLLGLIGRKVDTVDWCKEEISRLNIEIAEARSHVVNGKFLGSAFIRCRLQMGAHVLAQCVSFHEPNTMNNKWMEAHPKDIVWRNLDDGALEMKWRYVTSWVATVGLLIALSFPVAFVGTLSNVDNLCERVRWLSWVCRVPKPLPGLIQGVLPPILLAILFALLPFILRALAWYECIPRYSLMSVSVYKRFFLFLVIDGFLIVTITSGITEAIEDILEQPTQTVSKLAQELPGASVFFLTYMITQGLAGAGGALIQLMPLILHYIQKWFLGRTPRQAYRVNYLMPAADLETILPRLSLLATIGFAYSIIAPLISLLALVSFIMFFIAWKFLFTQVFDQPDESETGGMYFPMAMSNLFIGLYIKQITLACLFFLKISVSKETSLAGGILMIILFVFTLMSQLFIKNSFDPISQYLPMSLATKKIEKRYNEARETQLGMATRKLEEIDLFSRDRIRSVRKTVKALPKKIDLAIDVLRGKAREYDEDTAPGIFNDAEKRDQEKDTTEVDIKEADMTDMADMANERTSDDSTIAAHATGASQRHQGIPMIHRTTSSAGSASIKSAKSGKSDHSQKSDLKRRSSIPVFEPAPAPMQLSVTENDANEDDEDLADQLNDNAFDHPSSYVEQRWIWIPKDELGLSELIVADLKAAGVQASDLGSTMDKRGVVEVTRSPPEEDE